MAYTYTDIASSGTKNFKTDRLAKIKFNNTVSSRSAETGRPLNSTEQSALRTLFAIAEFVDLGEPALERRIKGIPRGKARFGLLKYTARSLFDDVIKAISPDAAERFHRNAQYMMLSCEPRRVTKEKPWENIVYDDDLVEIANAAWRGTCEMCDKCGTEAKQCALAKAFAHTMVLNPSDGSSGCLWRDM